jgi:hypothetical protein
MRYIPLLLVFLLAGCTELAFTDTPSSLKAAFTVTTQTEIAEDGLYEYTDWIQTGNPDDTEFYVYWETWDGDTFVKGNIDRFRSDGEYSYPGQLIVSGEQGTHILHNTYYYSGYAPHDCDHVFKYTKADGTDKNYKYVCQDLEVFCRAFQKDDLRLGLDERCPAWDLYKGQFNPYYQYSQHYDGYISKYEDPQFHKICVGSCTEIVTEFVENVVIDTCSGDADCAVVDGVCLTADNGQSYCVKEVIKKTEVEKISVIYEGLSCSDLPYKVGFDCVDFEGGAFYMQTGQDIDYITWGLWTIVAAIIMLGIFVTALVIVIKLRGG